MNTYRIIPITPDYIESYNRAVSAVVNEREYLVFLEPPTLEMSRAFVLGNLKRNLPHFIAVENNKVVGWCDLSISEFPIYSHIGSLGMGVIAVCRGCGIGEALLKATLEQAKAIGLTRIEFKVRETNTTAIHLYEKLGFIKEGIHKSGARVGKEYKTLISMALLI